MRSSYSTFFTLIGATAALEYQQPISGNILQETAETAHKQYPTVNLDQIIKDSPLLSFHRDIIKIPSITEHEKTVGEYIIDFLSSQNLTVEKQIVTPGSETESERFNIYAYAGENRYPDILLTSHIDTVPPFIPYTLQTPTPDTQYINREDLIIGGRGSVDAKASVAAITFAVLETLQESPDVSLGVLFDVGEEYSGIGMKTFSNSDLNLSPPTYKTIIFGEPTGLSLVAGHKGVLGFKVVARGKAAHSGYPWLGQSAISAILPVLQYLESLQYLSSEQGGLLRSEKFGASTLNIGVICGGQASNVVPDYAEATVAVRLADGTPDDTREIIRKAVDRITSATGSVSIDFEDLKAGSPPQHLDADVDGFDVITVNYGTDVPSLKIHDQGTQRVKRYLYGPGSIHVAHGDNEAITVGELERAVDGYKKLIAAAV
ncbi:Peptidase M20 [Penicillium malachiteum]|nr:Peptidase M20 [Penicillium malachiteum]